MREKSIWQSFGSNLGMIRNLIMMSYYSVKRQKQNLLEDEIIFRR